MTLAFGRNNSLLRNYLLFTLLWFFFAIDPGLAQQKIPFSHLVTFTQMEGMGKLDQMQNLFWSPSKNRLLVADTGNNRLLFFGDKEGKFRFLYEFKPEKMVLPISAVETSKGKVIAIERGTRGIISYDPDTGEKQVLTNGFPGASSFWPTRLTMDNNDNLYIIDQGNQRIYIFDQDLRYKSHINPPVSNFTGFSALTVDKNNNLIALEGIRGIIYVFNKQGRVVRQFGQRGKLRGETDFPVDIAVDSQGRIYVLDAHQHQVVLFDRNGDWQGQIGEKGWKKGKFIFPYRITIAPDYRLFVIDAGHNRLQALKPTRGLQQR